jgi:predicted ABC-type exoprotein transport system permease subunit
MILCILYLAFILVGVYYFNLITQKEQYTRDELKNVIPFFKESWKKVSSDYPASLFLSILVISAFFGVVIPMIFRHWVTNSSIFFVILFFILPLVKKYLEKSQVAESKSYSDNLSNLFIRYMDIIITGFGTGLGSALIYNWRDLPEIYSPFFLINIIIISLFLGHTVKNVLKEE